MLTGTGNRRAITLNPKLDREKEEIVTRTWKELSEKKMQLSRKNNKQEHTHTQKNFQRMSQGNKYSDFILMINKTEVRRQKRM